MQVAFALSFPGTTKHFTPQQVFVSLRSTVTHVLATAAAKAAQGSGDYTATITPDLVAKQLGKQVMHRVPFYDRLEIAHLTEPCPSGNSL